MELELGLGLALPSRDQAAGGGAGFLGILDGGAPPVGGCGKRAFGEAFRGAKATLPLFVRDGMAAAATTAPATASTMNQATSESRKRLVGWPPVKCAHYSRPSCGGGGYVKVKMEGVAIGRKVDVSLHGSYDELLRTLARMFPSAKKGAGADAEEGEVVAEHERRRHGYHYVVTYEDGEGDWLLVGDVPWEAFAKSVKRLKILA